MHSRADMQILEVKRLTVRKIISTYNAYIRGKYGVG
jgi:hypothetical protein